jgi:hypothetical protein
MSLANISIPLPAGNGTGTPVDISSLGPDKTVIIDGTLNALISIDVSQDGVVWNPIPECSSAPLTGPGVFRFTVVAKWARSRVGAFQSGGSVASMGASYVPNMNTFISLPLPVGDGAGTPVNVADAGGLWTVIYGGSASQPGTLSVEISDDGVNFAPVLDTFTASTGIRTAKIQAAYARAVRRGGPAGTALTLGISNAGEGNDSGQTSQPTSFFIYRPFDSAGPRENVYTDWNACYAAMREAVVDGPVQLMLDNSFCPVWDPPIFGGGAYPRPLLTLPAGYWDMRGIWLASNSSDYYNTGGCHVAFEEGCVLDGVEIINGKAMSFYGNSQYTTPMLLGGTGGWGGERTPMMIDDFRLDIVTYTRGKKPLFKGAGNYSAVSQSGITTFSSVGNPQASGLFSCASPIIDVGDKIVVTGNLNFENNVFTSLLGTFTNAPLTSITVAAAPGDTVITVADTSDFPASGTIKLSSGVYSEDWAYTSKTPTTFVGTTPIKLGFPGRPSPSWLIGSYVTLPYATKIGDTTVKVQSTAGFPASGAFRFNGGELVTYTGMTATSFTGCSPVTKNYPIGYLIEPPTAYSTAPIAVGATSIAVHDTGGFPAAGSLYLFCDGVAETVTYTGKTPTSFTGVSPTVNAYGSGASMQTDNFFVGGILATMMVHAPATAGRLGTQVWYQPMLDLSSCFVLPSLFASPTNNWRSREVVRPDPLAAPGQVTTASVAVDATSIPVASTAGYPSSGYLMLDDGTALTAYFSMTPTSFDDCDPVMKALPLGATVRYGVVFGELLQIDATAAVDVALPTAYRSPGERVIIKEIAGGAAGISVWPPAGQTIDGAAGAYAIAGAFGSKTFVSNGFGNWMAI